MVSPPFIQPVSPGKPAYISPPVPVILVPKPSSVTYAVPKPQQYNIPKPKPGFVDYPKFQGLRDPHTGYPMPTLPKAWIPLPKPIVRPPELIKAIPQPKPGYVDYPTYKGPRDPLTGYPTPSMPVYAVPKPSATVFPAVKQVAVPQQKPGFVDYPAYKGPRDPNTGYPAPVQGSYSVPPLPTSNSLPPQVTGTTPPAMKPGFALFPNYSGPRNPATGYPVPGVVTHSVPIDSSTAQTVGAPVLTHSSGGRPAYMGSRNPATGFPIPGHPSKTAADREKASQFVRLPPRAPPAAPVLGLDFRVIGIALPHFE